jgi:hypothetical protein
VQGVIDEALELLAGRTLFVPAVPTSIGGSADIPEAASGPQIWASSGLQ